jgi:hypothetical protein
MLLIYFIFGARITHALFATALSEFATLTSYLRMPRFSAHAPAVVPMNRVNTMTNQYASRVRVG